MSEQTKEATAAPSPRRRFAPADVVCSAGLAAGFVASYVLAALTPSLLHHHVILLEALAGSTVSIVTGGAFARVGNVALTLVLVAPLCGVALYDVFAWWAGRRWGTRLVEVYAQRRPRAGRAAIRAEALIRRRGVWALAVAYYLPIPNVLLYLSCGAGEMPLWTFVLGDVVGTLLWEALLVSLGWAVGHDAVRVVTGIDRHATGVTLAVVVTWLAVSLVMRARRRRERPPIGVETPNCPVEGVPSELTGARARRRRRARPERGRRDRRRAHHRPTGWDPTSPRP